MQNQTRNLEVGLAKQLMDDNDQEKRKKDRKKDRKKE